MDSRAKSNLCSFRARRRFGEVGCDLRASPGSFLKRSTWNTSTRSDRDEDGFLSVEAVFGLLENGVCVEFQDFLADLFAPVGG